MKKRKEKALCNQYSFYWFSFFVSLYNYNIRKKIKKNESSNNICFLSNILFIIINETIVHVRRWNWYFLRTTIIKRMIFLKTRKMINQKPFITVAHCCYSTLDNSQHERRCGYTFAFTMKLDVIKLKKCDLKCDRWNHPNTSAKWLKHFHMWHLTFNTTFSVHLSQTFFVCVLPNQPL